MPIKCGIQTPTLALYRHYLAISCHWPVQDIYYKLVSVFLHHVSYLLIILETLKGHKSKYCWIVQLEFFQQTRLWSWGVCFASYIWILFQTLLAHLAHLCHWRKRLLSPRLFGRSTTHFVFQSNERVQSINLGASSIFVLQWHNWVKWAKRVWNRIQMYDAKQTPDDHERVCWKTSNWTIQQYLLFTELLFCLVRAPLIALMYNLVDSNHFPC